MYHNGWTSRKTSFSTFIFISIADCLLVLRDRPFKHNMWSALSIAPYALSLGLFSLLYFVVFPWVEYVRDPKGMCLTRPLPPTNLRHPVDIIRASKIPQPKPLLWDVCGTFHDLSIERVPLERASGTTQNQARHSNRTQYVIVR